MPEHSYIRVQWHHSSPDDPVDLWSELDAGRREIRKVEIWADGRVGYAFGEKETGGTQLGKIAVPSLDEINRDPHFDAKAITKPEFERCWKDATPKG